MAGVVAALKQLLTREEAAFDDEQQEFVREAAKFDDDRLVGYDLVDHYYDGDQGVKLDDRAKEFLASHGMEWSENFCETVIDILVEHLSLEAFEVAGNQDAARWLTETWWVRTGMAETQGTINHHKFLRGDAFLIFEVDEDDGMPQACWNDASKIKVVYDDGNEDMLYLVKRWPTSRKSPSNPDGDPITRLNIWFPDRIEQWFAVGDGGDGADWQPHLTAADVTPRTEVVVDEDTGEEVETEVFDDKGEQVFDERWPVWWTDTLEPDGEPLGIPAIHFRHKARGKAYGRSAIKGTIAQQDLLNKQVLDTFNVGDAQGWPQRWGIGIPEDANLRVRIGTILRASRPDAKFGQFEPADPGPMLEAIEKTLIRIAARNRIPLHLLMLGGSLPSGETLKTAYTPVVKATEDSQVSDGRRWAKAGAMALKLFHVFGEPDFAWDPEKDTVDVVWVDPQPRNDTDEITNALVKQDLGVSRATTLRELGYDPDAEAKLVDKEAKAAAKRAPAMAPLGPGDEPPADEPADEGPSAA